MTEDPLSEVASLSLVSPSLASDRSFGKRHRGEILTLTYRREDAFTGNRRDVFLAAVQTSRSQSGGLARVMSAAGEGRTDAGGAEFDVLNKPYGRSELTRKSRVILDDPTGVS